MHYNSAYVNEIYKQTKKQKNACICTICYNTVYNFKKLSYWPTIIVALWMCKHREQYFHFHRKKC